MSVHAFPSGGKASLALGCHYPSTSLPEQIAGSSCAPTGLRIPGYQPVTGWYGVYVTCNAGRHASDGRKADDLARKQFFLLLALAIGIAVEAGLIRVMSGHGDFLQKGEASKFTVFGVGAGLAYWIAVACFGKLTINVHREACVFWLTAVLLRLLILPITPGDDVWRYRWEGMIQLHGFNPYQSGPESPALAALRNSDWSKINHRGYPAIYPPLTEAIFAAVAAAGNSLCIYKAIFALADLAGIAVLRRLLVRSNLPANQAAWYAWNPLAIYTFAGAAHFDSLMTLALLGAIWALGGDVGLTVPLRSKWVSSGESGWCCLSALFLGAAIAIKIAPLALLPVWMLALQTWRRIVVLLPVAFAPLVISALIYGYPAIPVFSTLTQFGTSFRVNDPFWWIIEAVGWSNPSGSNVPCGVCALFTCGALAFWLRHDWRRGLFWVWGAALLLSPVVHAWYVVWVLPLAAWRGVGARAWFVFSISTFGYFLLWDVNHASGRPWEEPLWLRLLILLPPLIYLAGTKLIGGRASTALRQVETIEFVP